MKALHSDTNIEWSWTFLTSKINSKGETFLHIHKLTTNPFHNQCGIISTRYVIVTVRGSSCNGGTGLGRGKRDECQDTMQKILIIYTLRWEFLSPFCIGASNKSYCIEGYIQPTNGSQRCDQSSCLSSEKQKGTQKEEKKKKTTQGRSLGIYIHYVEEEKMKMSIWKHNRKSTLFRVEYGSSRRFQFDQSHGWWWMTEREHVRLNKSSSFNFNLSHFLLAMVMHLLGVAPSGAPFQARLCAFSLQKMIISP